jgi:hypothetical protein
MQVTSADHIHSLEGACPKNICGKRSLTSHELNLNPLCLKKKKLSLHVSNNRNLLQIQITLYLSLCRKVLNTGEWVCGTLIEELKEKLGAGIPGTTPS